VKNSPEPAPTTPPLSKPAGSPTSKDSRTRLQKRKHGISLTEYRSQMRLFCLRGEQHPKAKLTLKQVLFIRASSLPSTQLAEMFSVNPRTIRDILNYTTWANALPERK